MAKKTLAEEFDLEAITKKEIKILNDMIFFKIKSY